MSKFASCLLQYSSIVHLDLQHHLNPKSAILTIKTSPRIATPFRSLGDQNAVSVTTLTTLIDGMMPSE